VTDASSSFGDPNKPLRHRAFFAAAGQLPEGSNEYRTMLAGLLVLRLLDKWEEPKGTSAEDNDTRIRDFVPVKNNVETIVESPVKRVLADLIEAIRAFSYGESDGRLPRLIAYAQFLEDEKHWEPAVDAYGTAIELIASTDANADLLLICYERSAYCARQVARLVEAHHFLSIGIDIATNQRDDSTRRHDDAEIAAIEFWLTRMRIAIATLAGDLLAERQEWESAAEIYIGAIELIKQQSLDRGQLPHWYERAAYCLRQIGQIPRAKDLLHEGIEVARALRDMRTELYLRISNGVLELQTGDLPQAESELDAIIHDAKNASDQEMLARATHERGMVAYERNQLELAVGLFHAAAAAYTEPRLKHRVLPDVAMALGDLGHVEHARKVYYFVRHAPQTEPEPRTIAGLNLMRIAELSGDKGAFDRYRAEVEKESMSGRLRAHFHLIAGQGFRRFGDIPAARAAFEEAIILAEQHRVYKLLTEADAMLSSTDDRPILWKQPEESPNLARVFEEIDSRRGPFAGATYG
jgi:tetratricopeptide (TPR) repeat protein